MTILKDSLSTQARPCVCMYALPCCFPHTYVRVTIFLFFIFSFLKTDNQYVLAVTDYDGAVWGLCRIQLSERPSAEGLGQRQMKS